MNRLNIKELFPVPALVELLPNNFKSLVPYFNSLKLITNNNNDTFGYYSENTYILNEPECTKLSNYILDRVYLYGYHCLGIDSERSKYRFTQSWVSVKNPNEKHEFHTHPNSVISGVIFLEGSKDTPGLSFVNQPSIGNYGKNTLDFSERNPKDMVENNDGYKCYHPFLGENIPFQPGLMILFPSYLQHMVPMNNSDIPRKSIAFNIIQNPMGKRGGLTELKF
jgi:uncharacterized protein (TIGR02466 family)